MQVPAKPHNETERLASLRALNILDTLPEERFDRLTRLAKRLFNVPIAVVSLVDEERQWFKSCDGLTASETPRDVSFCGHAILGQEVFVVPDAARDLRFSDNPLVAGDPRIRFYAGCPIAVSKAGSVGTLCLIDREPRHFDDEDVVALRDLACMVERELAAVQMATMDELTNLSNRRGFLALAEKSIHFCKRLQRPATLLYFDLDLFKQINDQFGHAEGDRALVSFATLLKETFRQSDVLGRLGGDEFAVFAADLCKDELTGALDRFSRAVCAHNVASGRGYALVYSVGAVQCELSHHFDLAELMKEADALMYERKQRRKLTFGMDPDSNGEGRLAA